MHINYFGDSVLFTGWAILAASVFAFSIPVLMIAMFVFVHIPPLDAYLAQRYGDEFKDYAAKTAKFVPFVY
jgi:protein-S-isoprenylcysteine O-methyltransferase Ste14